MFDIVFWYSCHLLFSCNKMFINFNITIEFFYQWQYTVKSNGGAVP